MCCQAIGEMFFTHGKDSCWIVTLVSESRWAAVLPGRDGVPQRGCLLHREKPNDLRELGALNRVGIKRPFVAQRYDLMTYPSFSLEAAARAPSDPRI